MGGGVRAAAERIARVAAYQAQFIKVFGHDHGERQKHQPVLEVTEQRIRIALASYMRSLSSLNSRFDRAVRGDTHALTYEERQGFNVFMGKAKCGTCHFVPFFNGTVPPDFLETEVEVIGTPTTPVTHFAKLDTDIGASKINRAPLHNNAFKTPTLRNIVATAPYMHNGVYPTLESVIDFYDRGGGIGVGAHVPNQTLPPDKLNLTPSERDALLAFLKSLTDQNATTRECRPLR